MHASKDSMWRRILKFFAKWSATKQHPGRPKGHLASLYAFALCLVVLLVFFVCIFSFVCPPLSRTSPFSRFLLLSWCRMTWFTQDAETHASDTKKLIHACIQTQSRLVLNQQQRQPNTTTWTSSARLLRSCTAWPSWLKAPSATNHALYSHLHIHI